MYVSSDPVERIKSKQIYLYVGVVYMILLTSAPIAYFILPNLRLSKTTALLPRLAPLYQ